MSKDSNISSDSITNEDVPEITVNNAVFIDGKAYIIIHKFDIYHAGWDVDSIGYIIRIDGKYRFVWSHKGKYMLVDSNDDSRILLEFMKNYARIIEEMNIAHEFLRENY